MECHSVETMPECSGVAEFKKIIEQNRGGNSVGSYAVCSSHPWVVESAIRQATEDGSLLHIESTSSQVNQFGGYSGQTPRQFAETVCQAARNGGLPAERVLLGADHLGPYPWRGENSASAMEKGRQLAHQCVLAGYQKIHLDASMSCADDSTPLDQGTIAERAALLCAAAERAAQQLPPGSAAPVYVIGTEVPTPGGEVGPGQPPAVTTADDAGSTLKAFASAFHQHGLSAAWERVIGLVVQPGVEFGNDVVWDYDAHKARALSAALPTQPALVYEAHSTDYQRPGALAQMVKDHFAILKVGPALTFAFREAVFALSSIERELLGSRPAARLSRVRAELDAAMLRNPAYWQPYYIGDAIELQLARAFSLSDRCRYYWHEATVQKELEQLLANLAGCRMPPGLLNQYLPRECEAVRCGALQSGPSSLIHHHIRAVLETYAAACRLGKSPS
jgi:D-tagatose-1,6-bisphosphate aldolase subunit GatZ/KbaZ